MGRFHVTAFASRDDAERHYLSEVDRHAEAMRQHFISPGDGQALAYGAKLADAEKVLNGSGDSATPWLDGEAEARGMTRHALADLIVQRRDEWVVAGAAIEAAKARAKSRVREAVEAGAMMKALRQMQQELTTLINDL